jgi:ArsR family transcriptional regulator|nr:metalloregulator ArsR/SmtB family transcription factor [Neorhizobium tomejilense]
MIIEKAASQLEALGNVTRLRIFRALVRAGDDGMPVGRLQGKIEIPGSTLSHHLKKLVDTGLVIQDRQATTLVCRANYKNMNGLIGYLVDECCADAKCAKSPAEEAA